MAFIPAAFAAVGSAMGVGATATAGAAAVAAGTTTAAAAAAATTAATIAGVSIVGTGVSLAGTAYSALAQSKAGKAQQSLNNYNAALSDQSAMDAARDSRIKANAQRAQAEKIKARQRALYAKAGVVSATGTPLMVQVAQAGELEMAALEQEQAGNAEAARLRSQAVLDRMSGSAARLAGNLNATATILQGVGSAAQIGMAYKGAK